MKQILLVIILLANSFLCGAADIMPLKDVRPGMRGIGLTVFEGSQIEQFDVEVIEVVHNYYPHRDLILIRLLGEKVNHTGVVSGMSGSPIYIDSKLIGALAYRVGDFMKDPIAGVTPIEEMLDISSKEKVRNEEFLATQNPTLNIKEYFSASQFQKSDIFKLLVLPNYSNFNGIQPIKIPLVMTGLSENLYQQIGDHLIHSNFILSPGGKINSSEDEHVDTIKPGSAVAAVIINGDFDISAVGTVTYRNGDRVLAFGHPFFNSGPVNIPLAEANVITTLASLYASNKYAVATNIIGNIRQDRSSGIMGVIGEMPPLIPVRVKVKSPILPEKEFHYQIVNDRSMGDRIPVFLWITLLNTLESARLGAGDYSLKLIGKIELENSSSIILDDFYSGGSANIFSGSGMDISEAAFNVVMTLSALLNNDFENPTVKGIELEFFAQPGRKLAEIENVYYDKDEVRPGDSLNLVIFLRPYQGKKIELSKQVIFPENLISDYVTIAVGGKQDITRWEFQAGINRFTPSNFRELVLLLNQRRKNKDIIVQLKVRDSGAILHGREFPTLPPSVFHLLKDSQTQKNYEPVTEKIVGEWFIPFEFEVRGGRKFNIKIKHD